MVLYEFYNLVYVEARHVYMGKHNIIEDALENKNYPH